MKVSRLSKNIPLLRFGLLADVQYADNDDKPAWYDPTKTRFYRYSLRHVEEAFKYWEKLGQESNGEVSFILQLGDIIDGLNKSTCSHSAINRTLSCFLNNPKMPTFHTVGNHELYNFKRFELSNLFDEFLFKKSPMNVKRSKSLSSLLYYKFNPQKGIKFISLDTYDISVLGYEKSDPRYQLASSILQTYHGHDDFDLWDNDQKLIGSNKRFQSSNGAISDEQLNWLDAELHCSDLNNELVIVFGHIGLHPKSCGWDSIAWNYDQVIDCFNRHSSVVAYFNGHAHTCGYAFENNIHFIVLHGIIETPPENEAFATVTIFEDRMIVDGKGVEKTINIVYHKKFALDQKDESETLNEDIDDHSLICNLGSNNQIKVQV